MIVVIAKFKVKKGKRDEFIAQSQPCIQATRLEDGNFGYDALLDPEDSDGVVYVEQWESMDKALVHMKSEHFIANQSVSEALREGQPEVTMYDATLRQM